MATYAEYTVSEIIESLSMRPWFAWGCLSDSHQDDVRRDLVSIVTKALDAQEERTKADYSTWGWKYVPD